MKALTTKEFVSVAVIAFTAPVLALGVIVAALVVVATGYEFMPMGLTLCGAVVSGIKGLDCRTVRPDSNRTEAAEGHNQAWPSLHEC